MTTHADDLLPPDYRTLLAPYREPSLRKSTGQLALTVGPLLILWAAMWYLTRYSYWLALAPAPLAALFMVRAFVLHHDCGHHALFRSPRANDVVGFALGLLTMTPYHRWRRNHALHHATSGDLDRRGHGDIFMLTVREYREATPWKRFSYRTYRHPLFLLAVGPWIFYTLGQRFSYYVPRTWRKERYGGYATNLCLAAAIAGVSWLVSFRVFLLLYLPVALPAATVGVWLLVAQHFYEQAYWREHGDWEFEDAALRGSSHLDLPPWLAWFTADIGVHHLHHLDSRIPNYRLRECLGANPGLRAGKRLTLWESRNCLRMTLWDERRGVMVGFADVAREPAGAAAGA